MIGIIGSRLDFHKKGAAFDVRRVKSRIFSQSVMNCL